MKHKHGFRAYILFSVFLPLLLASALTPCLAREEHKVIRVAFPQVEGYSMTAEDGSRYGLVVDVLNEVAKYTGWKYDYIDVDNDDVLKRFMAGDFDLMGGQYYMDGLEKYYGYPQYNCGYSKLILWARKEDPNIKGYDLRTFNGKTIGVFERAKENVRRLQIYLELNDIDCTLKYYNYNEMMETGNLDRFLENGEVDLLLGNSVSSGDSFYIAATFDSQPHYIVTMPDNTEILDSLNVALSKIYEADPNFAKKLYEANFPAAANLNPQLSASEKEYVNRRGAVTVAVPRDWHPMICLNNSDEHEGLAADVLKEISSYSGLQFTYLYCDTYAQALNKLQQGKADILGFYLGAGEDAISQSLALTTSYTQLNSILVRNKESSYPAEGLSGAVIEGTQMPEDIIADKVISYSNMEEALSDVNQGKVDFFYGISAHIENIIQKNNFTNLVQVNLINDNLEVSFALNSPVHPELFSILHKSLHNLSDEEKAAISNRNLISIGESHMTLLSIVYANPALAIAVVSTGLLLILIVVIIISRSRLHAVAMRAELARAAADSQAKSEFLSRMSHEIRTPMNAIVGLTDLMGMDVDLTEKSRESLKKIKSSSQYLLGLINDILDMSRIENGKMTIASEPFSLCSILDEIEGMLIQEAANKGLQFHIEKEFRDDVLVGDAIRLRQVILNLLSNAFKFTPSGGRVSLTVREDASTEQNATYTICIQDTGIGIAQEEQQRIFKSFEQLGSNYSKSQGTGLGLAISKNIIQLMGGELQLKSELDQGSEFYFTITCPKGQLDKKPELEGKAGAEIVRGAKILLAEDNHLNAEIAMELLRSQGATVRWAENGKAVLEMFSQSKPGDVDVILMDVQMPEMNGLEATRAIRALSRPDAKSVPILAMTANAFKEDEKAALDAGMNDFIPKPIDVKTMYQKLYRALHSSCES